MSRQVAVEETQRVAVERETDGHAPFVTLGNRQDEKQEAVESYSMYLVFKMSREKKKRTHDEWKNNELFLIYIYINKLCFHLGDSP